MPNILNKDMNDFGIIITFSGMIDADEINQIHKIIKSDELFPKMRYQIWDFSEAKALDISLDQMRNFAVQNSVAARENPNIRIAIIPRKLSSSGLEHMFQILERIWGGYESETFWDVDTARKWGKSIRKSERHVK